MSAVAAATDAMLARLLEPQQPVTGGAMTERILDATLNQFLLVGLRRTTIDDVARRAGVSRVTIYRRVGQKHELVEAVILREVRRVIAATGGAIESLQSAEERVVEAFVFGLRALREHPLLQRLLETEPEDLLPYLTVDAGASLAVGRRFIAAQIRDGRPTGRETELVAEILTRLAHSLVLTPEGSIPLENEQRMRSFARACLAPLAGV